MFCGKINISKCSLNLKMMLTGGQCFRWKETSNNEWTGVVANIVWKIRQCETYIQYEAHLGERSPCTKRGPLHSCSVVCTPKVSKKSLEDFLKWYFRLSAPLEQHYEEWSQKDSHFKSVASKCYGIRILNQEPVENLFSFICSSNNNIPRISGMVEKLGSLYGHKICDLNNVTYYEFPDVSALAHPSVDETLRKNGFGYRAKFIQQSAKQIDALGGLSWLNSLKETSYKEAKAELIKLHGIGAKVADCICLMSLGHMDALPVDTHVFQIASEIYLPHLRSVKTVTDRVYNEIGDFFRNLFGPLAGWAHTILFCADLKSFKMNLKENETTAPRKRLCIKPEHKLTNGSNLRALSGSLQCTQKELNLRITLNSGQTYRFKEIGPDVWRGVFSSCVWTLTQYEDKVDYTVHYPEDFIFIRGANFTNHSNKGLMEMFSFMLNDYFRMDFNLAEYYRKWSESDDHFREVSSTFCGLRMIKQDIVENLFAFLCSSNNTISRMTTMIESLCTQYGDKIGNVDEITYYDFPKVERISHDFVEEQLRKAKFGFRAKYVQQSAKQIVNNGGDLWFGKLKKLPYEEAKGELMTLPGIAAKVADCICLTALDHLETIPVDTHVFQIAKKYYLPHLKEKKTITKDAYQQIGDCFRQTFGSYSGWAHTVLFCSDLRQHAKL